ncbi:MAG: pseudouridine synthase [Polyangiaceae bacterium]
MGDEPAILFEGEHVAVAFKPAGMATEPEKSGAESLRDWLDRRTKRRTHALSRLDMGVSGAVTFSLDHDGARLAEASRARGTLQKTYAALVLRDSSVDLGERGVWRAPVDGKPAETRYRVVDRVSLAAGREVVALACEPVTGRTHQIRLHASGAGAPILGDRKYRGSTSVVLQGGAVVAVPRLMLHALSVALDATLAPPDGRLVVAPAPFSEFWVSLGGARSASEFFNDGQLTP